jgi:hypothetical protein
VLPVSARTGEGIGRWYDWLRHVLARGDEPPEPPTC